MRKDENKVSTKMLKSMKPGDAKVLTGQTYNMLLSARALCSMQSKRYDMDARVTYVEKADGTYEITVKRWA